MARIEEGIEQNSREIKAETLDMKDLYLFEVSSRKLRGGRMNPYVTKLKEKASELELGKTFLKFECSDRREASSIYNAVHLYLKKSGYTMTLVAVKRKNTVLIRKRIELTDEDYEKARSERLKVTLAIEQAIASDEYSGSSYD